ncbi:hypothetical protein [Streptomyces xiamenensis]|uniref:hypothetical protein n=1 Tax=Streptomyces xiamenensis TaxID=408015 RepID=UPI0035DDD119
MGRPDGSILWDDGTILHPDGRLESPTGQTIQNADEIPAEISARDRSILDSTTPEPALAGATRPDLNAQANATPPDSPPPSQRPDPVPTEGPTRDLPGQRTPDSTPSSPSGGGGGGGGNFPDDLPDRPSGSGHDLPENPGGSGEGISDRTSDVPEGTGRPEVAPPRHDAPANGMSNRERPPREGDTDYIVDDPNNWSDTITDIDRIEDGTLWEEKTATIQ